MLNPLRLVRMFTCEPLRERIPFRPAEVVCTCDGLALLKNHYGNKNYVLWNPSTREYRTLIACPYWNANNNNLIMPSACGLWYDSRVDDYKVIVMMPDSIYGVYS